MLEGFDFSTSGQELLVVEIGGQEYCLDVGSVREIRVWTPATPLAHAPDYIQGMINLRGQVMPVIDLRCRLGLGRTEASSRHVIVVIEDRGATAGLLVDGVQETIRIQAGAAQAAPDFGVTADNRLVDAVIPLEGRMISRLVAPRLMNDEVVAIAA